MNKLLNTFGLFILIAWSQAGWGASCTLEANPDQIFLGDQVTLTITSSGGYEARIDNRVVRYPTGTLTLSPSSLGTKRIRGAVLATSGEKFCFAEVKVVARPLLAELVGNVTSAADGQPLDGVTLTLTPHNLVTTSNGAGVFSYSDVPLGGYTITAELNGYTTETYQAVAVAGTNPPIHIVMNPILPDGQVRFVLTWGAEPSDLDSHLFTTWDTGEQAHIWYSNKTELNTTLDVDDVTSYGPETVTVLDTTPGLYTYAILDYSNKNGTGEVATADAVVKVYQGPNQINEFRPTNTGTETTWHVFDARVFADGSVTITPVNRYGMTDLDAQDTFP